MAVTPAQGRATHRRAQTLEGDARQRRRRLARLAGLKTAAVDGTNLVQPSIQLAQAGGTTGEWTAALEEALGARYQAPLGSEIKDAPPIRIPARAEAHARAAREVGARRPRERGVKLLAFACREAGMEVVYTGLKQTPAMIVATAVQEDVDLIGISSLSGSHLWIATEVLKGLRENGSGDIPIVARRHHPGERPSDAPRARRPPRLHPEGRPRSARSSRR